MLERSLETPFCVSIGKVLGKQFFRKIYQASLSSDFEWIVSGLLESCNMFLDRVVKSAFYMSEGSIWWKTKLSKILLFILSISDTERNFLGFMWNFLQPGRQNCILRVYRNNLRRIFCGKNVPSSFPNIEVGKALGLLECISRGGCRNCILRVYWNPL